MKAFAGTTKRIALAAGLGVFSLSPASAETLTDALVSAYETSGLLEQNRALLRAADEDVAQALSQLRPIIGWSADITHSAARAATASNSYRMTNSDSTSASIGLSAQLLVYDAGQTRLGVDVAKETVLSTRQSLIAVEQSVLLNAITAYLNVQLNQEIVKLRQNNVRVLGEELRAANDRFEVGEVTRTDVAQAESYLAQARASLTLAQGDLTDARLTYINVVGHAPGALANVNAAPMLPSNVDQAIQVALAAHPSLIQAQKSVTIAELQVEIARRSVQPTVSLNGSLGASNTLNSDARSNSATIGLSVSGPIYYGGQIASLQRQAMQSRDAARANLLQVSDDIREAAGSAYSQISVTAASRSASAEAVRAAQVAFEGVREEASLGARTTLEVLDSEQDLLDARANQISAEVNQRLAGYSLLSAMGKLTAKDLNLPVTLYDPTDYYNMVKGAPAAISAQGRSLDRVLRSIGKQ
ncbi:TolC family outer membrane protein [Pseudooceanicola nanhaiensis]|uniref:TolC family outer membrane protein n=1 Tax=Pseudooceanicola nanhaiensis TaxID=375761 RepID=UPI001CD27BF3|nr:TolC family outer membrane protein [Pseudooceanicola nanhaiensis]MCA0921993.1 TolC family outer membrane protein [Pseudooceanicola nanhaiensis]